MARSILILALLVAIAPSAAALSADLDPLAQTITSQVPAVPDSAPVPLETGGLDEVTVPEPSDLPGLPDMPNLGCTKAVEWQARYWTGRIADRKTESAEYLDTVTVHWVEHVPVVERSPATGTVPDAAPLVEGLGITLPAVGPDEVAGIVTRPVHHYDPVTVAVHVDWDATYEDWEHATTTYLLALPIGMPLVATGEGQLVEVCDGAQVLSRAPDPGAGPMRSWSPRSDGWRYDVVNVDAWRADAEDLEKLSRSCENEAGSCPEPCHVAITEALADLALSQSDVLAQALELSPLAPQPSDPSGTTTASATLPPVSATGASLGSNAAGVAGIGGAAALVAAALGIVLRRRLLA